MLNRQIVIAAVVGLLSSAQAAPIVYVDDDAPLGGDGQNWATAYRFLQDALTAASNPANNILLIRVAQGLYLPDRSEAYPDGTDDPWVSFILVPGILHLGGYAGLGAKNPSARDAVAYPAVLSGDLDGDAAHGTLDSRHVVRTSDSPTTMLDGFTIAWANGIAQGGGGLSGFGSLVLSDCVFVNNFADQGGALFHGSGELLISNCTFTANSGGTGGGAIVATGNSLMVDGCTFSNNSAGTALGGAIVQLSGSINIVDSTFLENSALEGGAIYKSSGAITVDACSFAMNTATSDGGALYVHASSAVISDCLFQENSSASASSGAVHVLQCGGPAFVGCTFTGNAAAGAGGAMRLVQSNAKITLCTYTGNAAGGGGAIHFDSSNPSITNCLFAGNTAVIGAAVNNFAGDPTLINCTFSENAATDSGGGIFNARGSPTVTNCVLWGNSDLGGTDESAQIDGAVTLPEVDYSLVQGGWSGGGVGNIASDPLFAEPFSGDFRLLPGSPSIDAGDTTAVPADTLDIDGDANTFERLPVDLDGNPRFVDDPDTPDTGCGFPAVVDIGAYEFQGVPFEMNLGDIDGDEVVATTDLLALLGAWGVCADACCLEDFDNDQLAGVTDLLILLANWD